MSDTTEAPMFDFDKHRVEYMAELLFVQYSGRLGESLLMQTPETQHKWLRHATSLEFLFGTPDE